MTKQIITIPATINRYDMSPLSGKQIRKAAGYARVSTDKDEQFSSYSAQVEYYTKYIKSKDDLLFVGVYTDEGITGTSTKKRKGFNRMIKDALNGKIDLIITKSISRFARNTVDSLVTIRKLKEKGIEVYFEKENIYTLDSKGELLITIMSSLAQEESRSISENVLWGISNSAKNGKVHVPFAEFVGYDRGNDGQLVVNKLQSCLIKRIFIMIQENMTCYEIAKELTKEKVPTPQLNSKMWYQSTIKSILQNEKYVGDALLRKTFCVDYLTKKRVKNDGQITQYYVKNSHEAIVDRDTFNIAKDKVNYKKNVISNRKEGTYLLQGKLFCPYCNRWYGYKTWHSKSKYEYSVWICNGKYKQREKCINKLAKEKEIIEKINDKLLYIYNNKKCVLFESLKKKRKQLKLNAIYQKEMDCIIEEASEIEKEIKKIDDKSKTRILKQYYFGILHRKIELKNMIRHSQEAHEYIEKFMYNSHTDEDIILFMWAFFFDYASIYTNAPMFRDNTNILINIK